MYLSHLAPVPARHLRQGLGRCLGQEVGRCIVGSRRPLPQRQRSFAGEAVDLDERTKHALGKGREGEGRGGEGGKEELCSNSSVVHNWIRIRPKTCTAPPPHTPSSPHLIHSAKEWDGGLSVHGSRFTLFPHPPDPHTPD